MRWGDTNVLGGWGFITWVWVGEGLGFLGDLKVIQQCSVQVGPHPLLSATCTNTKLNTDIYTFLITTDLKKNLPFLILYRLSEVLHFLYIMESGIRCATEFFFNHSSFFGWVSTLLWKQNTSNIKYITHFFYFESHHIRMIKLLLSRPFFSFPFCSFLRYKIYITSHLLDNRIWSITPLSTSWREEANWVRDPAFWPQAADCPSPPVESNRVRTWEASSSVTGSGQKHWRRFVIRVRMIPATGAVNSVRVSSSVTWGEFNDSTFIDMKRISQQKK